jgi:hypothetical protein
MTVCDKLRRKRKEIPIICFKMHARISLEKLREATENT